jgi:capsular polysaccharide export protein
MEFLPLIGIFSRKVFAQPSVKHILGGAVCRLYFWDWLGRWRDLTAVAGWGLRRTSKHPRRFALRRQLPYIALEDGFLRSFGVGYKSPSVSLIVDDVGIFYASDRPSRLEKLLVSPEDIVGGNEDDCDRAIAMIRDFGLSKYNLSPDFPVIDFNTGNVHKILVVDQTSNDASIEYGGAKAATFLEMLDAALIENPDSIIFVKTHPEVSLGGKQGHFGNLSSDPRIVALVEPVNPISLLSYVDHVYVVTSHLGFEALLVGKEVTCFGLPWYAGWGVTNDRQVCARRSRSRNVRELFVAAYIRYTRYLNPTTLEEGNIFHAISWLQDQREQDRVCSGRTIAIGFRRWKASNVLPFLSLDRRRVKFVRSASGAARLNPGPADRLVVWGVQAHKEVEKLALRSGAKLVKMEDGFLRSVGLGSDYLAPLSLVLDGEGLYFDARHPSDLENLLNYAKFSDSDLKRASSIRQLIVSEGISKYNVGLGGRPEWPSCGRRTVLIPGQVDDDASIRFGCHDVASNVALLKAVRCSLPEAYLVYKPHPDVLAKNRVGRLHLNEAMKYADYVELDHSIAGCIEAADEIHTMTSLAGFDALLRMKPVVVYGRPFYAGWGLTLDRLSIPRRTRKLCLDELVAASLIHYPIYWDPELKGFTSCEAVIRMIIESRDRDLKKSAKYNSFSGRAWRCWRKLGTWASAGFLLKW